jgi:hypothetical protein
MMSIVAERETPPTEFVEKIGDALIVKRNDSKTYTAYCTKYGVWKTDLKADTVNIARKNKSLSALKWPERAMSEIGSVYWDNLTILDVSFSERTKPYKGGHRVVKDAIAYCHCAELDVKGWVKLESIRTGRTKTLKKIPHHPGGFKFSETHREYFEGKTVTKMSNGYCCLTVNGKFAYAHHAAWELAGNPPVDTENGECLDHINRDRMDNRIENLRLVSLKRSSSLPFNGENRVKSSSLTSKYKGVCACLCGWEVNVTVKGFRHRKVFKTEREAAIAAFNIYEEANRLHGCIFSGHVHPDDHENLEQFA